MQGAASSTLGPMLAFSSQLQHAKTASRTALIGSMKPIPGITCTHLEMCGKA